VWSFYGIRVHQDRKGSLRTFHLAISPVDVKVVPAFHFVPSVINDGLLAFACAPTVGYAHGHGWLPNALTL
jgi:hypothetical protein